MPKIHGFTFIDIYPQIITIPDCFVTPANKIGAGHGEAKLYVGTKDIMYDFFGKTLFSKNCFLVKNDLLDYMNSAKSEYFTPNLNYQEKINFKSLWLDRVNKIKTLPKIIDFKILLQDQISGVRGYINSEEKSIGYNILREIALPEISYINIMKLKDTHGDELFYFKLFVDFKAIVDRMWQPYSAIYGNKNEKIDTIKEVVVKNEKTRKGQNIYREKLLSECPFCPITGINDERPLIASHIKPWAVCNMHEQTDPKNGFMLSPLFDALFDKGFITFTNKKELIFSNWLSPQNQKKIGLKGNHFPLLPLDDEREKYLEFHRENVFKK